MNIAKGLQERLSSLNAQRDTYRYTGQRALEDKVLARLVAPTAVGKSTIINRILTLAEQKGIDAAEVGTITTRPGRPNDPPNYKTANDGITHQSMVDRIENGELVSWSLFETGHLYATDYSSYPGTYNFLPCLPDSLPMQDKAGFGAVKTFYIVTSVDAWHEQLQERVGPGFDDRLEEAMSSIEFSQSTDSMYKFVSLPGEEALTETADRILHYTIQDNTTNIIQGRIYGPSESLVKDRDFDKHCHGLYRLAMQLVHDAQNQNQVDYLQAD